MKFWSVRPRDGTSRWSALAGRWADTQSGSVSVISSSAQSTPSPATTAWCRRAVAEYVSPAADPGRRRCRRVPCTGHHGGVMRPGAFRSSAPEAATCGSGMVSAASACGSAAAAPRRPGADVRPVLRRHPASSRCRSASSSRARWSTSPARLPRRPARRARPWRQAAAGPAPPRRASPGCSPWRRRHRATPVAAHCGPRRGRRNRSRRPRRPAEHRRPVRPSRSPRPAAAGGSPPPAPIRRPCRTVPGYRCSSRSTTARISRWRCSGAVCSHSSPATSSAEYTARASPTVATRLNRAGTEYTYAVMKGADTPGNPHLLMRPDRAM
ncbi:hypothetical protein SUDANB66_06357 (plasmid) [Streptomyces sp. SudanB66_2053]